MDPFNSSMNPPVPSVEEAAALPKTGITAVKPVVAIGVVVLLVLLAGAAAWLYLSSQDDDDLLVSNPGDGGSQVTTVSATIPVNRPAEPVRDVFKFRNIFAPTVAAPVSVDTSGSTTTSGTPAPTATTLTFNGVTTVDGALVALVTLGGQSFSLSAGEAITGTPWAAVSVTDDKTTPRLIMRYGDEAQPALAPGQSIQPPS